MKENKKNNYTAPAVKVVAFQVEQGFAGSPKYIGHRADQRSESSTPGTEQLDYQTTGWTGTYINN